MHILYLTHDLNDPSTARRVAMLRAGGAEVSVIGFSRAKQASPIHGCPTFMLGRTYAARFIHRLLMVPVGLWRIRRHKALVAGADLILARNLETLALAYVACRFGTGRKPIVYEVLDIHRLLLREDWLGQAMRWVEARLCRRVGMLLTSSPAFVREYYEKRTRIRVPYRVTENKVFGTLPSKTVTMRPAPPPWTIGWFGVIRCRKSFELLRTLVTQAPGRARVVIRGRVAYDQIPDFDEIIAQTPGMIFFGPYQSPVDLEKIYGEVHFAWVVDWFEEGKNSNWLLPYRMYDSGLYGVVPLALEGVETSRYLKNLGIGVHLPVEAPGEALATFLNGLNSVAYTQMVEHITRIPQSQWVMNEAECRELIADFKTLIPKYRQAVYHEFVPEDAPLLVVVPCLNEVNTIGSLITYLLAEAQITPMRIVIVDGGSRDGTVALVETLCQTHPELQLLHNPKRIQSAAVNLAVRRFGHAHRYLVRIDAHAHYPTGYIKTLLNEARMTGADSVVVSMNTIGRQGFERAVAAIQNSALGNGGSAHRNRVTIGRYVEHGHHALMRLIAFQSVGGYDESFSHNEDAELDARLTLAGYKLWLTAKTSLDYYPRSTLRTLFRQYLNYGSGRVRNLLRHRNIPRVRQLFPVLVAPAIVLALISPFYPLAAIPLAIWCITCLVYGIWLALKAREPGISLSGAAAIVMHSAWSMGFWQGLIHHLRKRRV